MPYSYADETACLQAGFTVDAVNETCESPNSSYSLSGFAQSYSSNNQTNQSGQWVGYVPTLTDSALDVLGFFGLGSRPTTTTPTGSTQQRNNYAPWIILGVILLLVIIAYFVLRKKK